MVCFLEQCRTGCDLWDVVLISSWKSHTHHSRCLCIRVSMTGYVSHGHCCLSLSFNLQLTQVYFFIHSIHNYTLISFKAFFPTPTFISKGETLPRCCDSETQTLAWRSAMWKISNSICMTCFLVRHYILVCVWESMSVYSQQHVVGVWLRQWEGQQGGW